MATPRDHRKWAEECVAMAHAAENQKDKALWLTLAQSFVRLAEYAERYWQSEQEPNGRESAAAIRMQD